MTFSSSECSATTTQFGNTSEITTNVSTYSSIHLSENGKKESALEINRNKIMVTNF